MIHEFLITEKYAIVPDLPLEFDPPNAIRFKKFLYNFNKSKKKFNKLARVIKIIKMLTLSNKMTGATSARTLRFSWPHVVSQVVRAEGSSGHLV